MHGLIDHSSSPKNVYIASNDNGHAVELVAMLMMEMLIAHAAPIAVFRPFVADNKTDPVLDFFCHRYPLSFSNDSLYGLTYSEAERMLGNQQYDELIKLILAKFQALNTQCSAVLCIGNSSTSTDSLFNLDLNLELANNLDCLVLPVIQSSARDTQSQKNRLASVQHALLHHDCNVLALIIAADTCHDQFDLPYPVFCLPEESLLLHPSMQNLSQMPGVEIISAQPACLHREIKNFKVAAMLLPEFLDYVEAGDLIITPSDRADIILASLLSYHSNNFPKIAGLLITGQTPIAAAVNNLINDLDDLPFAVLAMHADTYSVAMAAHELEAHINWQDAGKLAKLMAYMEKHINLVELRLRLFSSDAHKMTPLMFEYDILQRAKRHKQHIVLPEGEEDRILRAAEILLMRDVVAITLLGNPILIRQKIQKLSLNLDTVNIIDPLESELRAEFAEYYFQARQHKGVILPAAFDLMSDVSYFGTLMVQLGYADGMVSGAIHSTQHTIRPAFEIIKTKPEASIVSSVFFMCLNDQVLVYGDCAVNPTPNARQLAEIALAAADTASLFKIEPRVAMLSYSTGDSGQGEAVEKVREAVGIAKQLRPELKLDGPIQYDAAVDPDVARTKLSKSEVAGQASVLIFPDLNTGNNTYKAVQRSSGAVAIGPILQGLNKPVNDLSRGCTVTDIVNTVIITAIQAQQTAD
jgi:phosphate acetyltransferase